MVTFNNPGWQTCRLAGFDEGDILARLDCSETGFRQEALGCLDGLFGYAMALSQNQAEAEDLAQETYMRALRTFRRPAPDSSTKSWLYAILRDAWLDRAGHAQTSPECSETDDRDREDATRHGCPGEDPLAERPTKIDRKHVLAAVQQLPAPHREIILLREFEGLSYQEIGTILNCPIGAVMSRLGRARQKLRTLLSCAV
jgi:RNA polymerase sigma-70 factor (ECF subfamily)